ncbi:trypsin-like [Anomaloglossus baeobatrachus]|uniref:trypsin-like n=1 Tax=Anomaloglossus baeobatrachus TaxID=238106 RepID=UPI003F509F56
MRRLVFIAFLVAGAFSMPYEGEEDEKIINGYTCYKNSVPYQVSLRVAGRHYCGGALINNMWVLTSAQCYQNKIQVVLGEHDITTHEGTEMSIDVFRIFIHPDFNEDTLDNDIMMIKLARQISVNSVVHSVSLPSHCAAAGTHCLVSGWGNTSPSDAYYPSYTLQCLESPTVTSNDCSSYYPGRLTPNMFCAGRVGKFATCKGDEGGPLVCQGQLQGIVSWGNRCDAQRNNPWVYTKVCNYIYWINDLLLVNWPMTVMPILDMAMIRPKVPTLENLTKLVALQTFNKLYADDKSY